MGRKLKCTVEEKVAAVEDYLNGTRSVSEIMADLSIKSTRTIRDWILAYQNGGIEALCPVTANHSYSKEFKLEMIQRYIAGKGSVTELCARYGIPAHVTLQNWISLYNANRELRDYDPKREVYMAEARRKTSFIVPQSSSWCSFNSFAAPSSIVVCISCPQACILPGSLLLYSTSASSFIGRASISAPISTVLPGLLL